MRMRRTAVAVTTVATAVSLSIAGGTAAYAHTGVIKDRKPRPADSAKPKPSDSAKPKPTQAAKPRPTVTVTATVNPTATASPSATATKASGLLTPFLATGTLDAVNVKAGTVTVDVTSGSTDLVGKDVTVKVPAIAQVLLNGKSALPKALTEGLNVSVGGLRSDKDYWAGLVQAGSTPAGGLKAGVNLDVLRAAINLGGGGGLQAGVNLGGIQAGLNLGGAKPTTTPTPAPTVTVTQTASPGPTVTVTVTTTTTVSPKPTTSVEPGNPAPTASVEPGNP
ncbi:MAG TPA: hypothetical protein VN408_07245 [Actinoplanes sp.]|nr:hypothetical protein [Actinoplanes sp.]